jgi:hypothetical protein
MTTGAERRVIRVGHDLLEIETLNSGISCCRVAEGPRAAPNADHLVATLADRVAAVERPTAHAALPKPKRKHHEEASQ